MSGSSLNQWISGILFPLLWACGGYRHPAWRVKRVRLLPRNKPHLPKDKHAARVEQALNRRCGTRTQLLGGLETGVA